MFCAFSVPTSHKPLERPLCRKGGRMKLLVIRELPETQREARNDAGWIVS